MLTCPVQLNNTQAWPLLSTDIAALRVFERNVLDTFWIRSDNKSYEVRNDMDVMQCINIQCLHWLEYVVRMKDDFLMRWMFVIGTCGRRRRERIELSSLGVKNKRVWAWVLKQDEIQYLGCYAWKKLLSSKMRNSRAAIALPSPW